jgi:hypothetical protein
MEDMPTPNKLEQGQKDELIHVNGYYNCGPNLVKYCPRVNLFKSTINLDVDQESISVYQMSRRLCFI